MAIVKIDPPTASTPSYNPSISVDYNAQNDNLFTGIKGYNAVSLTNFDTTNSGPTVKAGSVLESNGALYNFTTDESPNFSLSWTGAAYLVFNDSSLQLEMAQDTPAWSAAKNGYYVGTKRFTGYIADYDGPLYSNKRKYVMTGQGSGFIILGHTGSVRVNDLEAITLNKFKPSNFTGIYGSLSVLNTGTLIPAGGYMFAYTYGALVQVYDGSSWQYQYFGEQRAGVNGFCVSDGVNFRLTALLGSPVTAHYRKIW